MNQHAFDAPQQDGDPSPDAEGSLDAHQPGVEHRHSGGAPPVSADLIDTTGELLIRVGSPFAADPFAPQKTKPIESVYDVGPLRYTAMGAVAASIMVLGFAGVALWWFPAGGALIAALGCVLSIFGLYSTYRMASSGLLAIHLGLFVLSYVRSLG